MIFSQWGRLLDFSSRALTASQVVGCIVATAAATRQWRHFSSHLGLSVIDTQKLKCTCQVVHASCYGCSDEQRIAAIDKFKKLPNCCALLINLRSSTHSAVAGLNLTEATVAYMLEPCLNFGLEAQAIARISRIGQRHPTKVTPTLRFK